MSSQSGFGSYDINNLFNEAQRRWLKPAEVLFILQNHDKYQLTNEPPQKPTSGSLYLFNKRVIRFFRRDGHNWRKKKDGRTVGEAHERLKGKPSPGSAAQLSPGSGTELSAGSWSGFSPSPGSVEVSSEFVIEENGITSMVEFTGTSSNEVSQFLRRLEEQLSLNEDNVEEIGPLCPEETTTSSRDSSKLYQYGKFAHEPEDVVGSQYYDGITGTEQRNDLILLQDSGNGGACVQSCSDVYGDVSEESVSWSEVLQSCEPSLRIEHQGYPASSLRKEPTEENHDSGWNNNNHDSGWNNYNITKTEAKSSVVQDSKITIPTYYSVMEAARTSSNYYSMFDEDQLDISAESGPSLTVAQEQKFTIREMSPEWGYTTEATKVIIVGSFLCDPSESMWTCMFGESEVPVEIIQDGVLRCDAPPHLPGKVNICVTSGNRLSCSEIREFEYREKAGSCANCNSSRTEVTKSAEELLLLVRFVQMLLSDSSLQKGDNIGKENHILGNLKADTDSWGHVMESLLLGSGTSADTVDWLLQQLLKEKLQQWLSSKGQERQENNGCSLSKKEQGLIHMVAGLGFEWALNPILSLGVSVDFRDINGWTALHWAARFGREKMVAALIASGASAGAVTDPNSLDPVGRTPAFIADDYGHRGLAAYLSELALTSHLSSLTLKESELSKGSAEVEAERTVDCISKAKLPATDDQVTLKETLAAVRNAYRAAARIQSAFRTHSFRKRQQREVAASASCVDEYGMKASEIQELSALSKMAFGSARHYHLAALSIQRKYRGWKGRKDFLALRQKVVKIQAHVRGYQVRKNYKVCWAVGILEKVVLRWRRKGVGLRGFRNDTDCIDESEDEDILKVFRKQKVDNAIDEAVSRVLSMVDSAEARRQYHRMLQRYQQAAAELGDTSDRAVSTSEVDVSDMENDSMYHFYSEQYLDT